MVSAYPLVSFVLPIGENDSPSPIIRDGYLYPYNVDCVGQLLCYETLKAEFYFTV